TPPLSSDISGGGMSGTEVDSIRGYYGVGTIYLGTIQNVGGLGATIIAINPQNGQRTVISSGGDLSLVEGLAIYNGSGGNGDAAQPPRNAGPVAKMSDARSANTSIAKMEAIYSVPIDNGPARTA